MIQLTIDAILQQRSLHQPTKVAYRYLLDGESKEISLTYRELNEKAQKIACALQRRKKGDDVLALLIYPSGLEFIGAFFGCLYAGVIAVPVPVPKKTRSLEHVQNILKSTQAMFILTDTATFTELQRSHFFTSLREIIWIITDGELEGSSQKAQFEKSLPQKLAFLQYTSGSTSTPKGVMISHENIIANQKMIKEAFAHDEKTVVVGWLPLFHDMGLVGTILQPLYLGITSILMSPIAFLQKPIRWLQAISTYHATTSGAPNFAYDLCIEKTTAVEKEKLNLACWKVAFNGAEPVHHTTLSRFSKAFSSYGFCEKAFYPCYGLAETTVFSAGYSSQVGPIFKTIEKRILEQEHRAVTSEDSINSLTLVSVGKAWGNEKILIVDPHFQTICKPCQVGEIWIQGQHVAQGYWNQLEVSQKVFRAFLPRKGFFLRTGDLGFWDEKENLFITGRLKDLMIIRGRNIYPQDVELSVEQSNSAFQPHGSAAFSIIQNGKEVVVIVAEIRREKMRLLNKEELFSGIYQSVSQDYQLSPAAIVLIKPNTLPKTSSGKVQRSKCKALFLEGKLEHIANNKGSWLSDQKKDVNLIEQELSLKIGEILHISSSCITSNASLNSYGMDSLGAIALQVFIETRWGISIAFEEFIEGCSLKSITDKILQSDLSERKEESKSVITSFSLSYQQLGIWLDTEATHNSYGYNLTKVIKIVSALDKIALRKTISLLVQRHALLRTTFRQKEELVQEIASAIDLPFEEKYLAEKDLIDFLEQEAIHLFSLETGPLFHIWLLTTDSDDKFLVFSIHHLVADLWSLGIFLNELFQIYESIIQNGVPVELPSTLPYIEYVSWQQTFLKSKKARKSLEYWKEKYQGDQFWLPSDKLRADYRTFRGSHLTFEIPFELAKSIKRIAQQENTTPFVIFLSAYFLLLYLYGGQKNLCIGTTTSGRGSSCYYSTFGMFANLVPVFLSFAPEWSFQFLVKRVKETILDAIGIHQLPFSYLLKHLQFPRDSNLSPLFQTLFVYQHVPTLTKELNTLIIPNSQGSSTIRQGTLALEPFAWNAPISTFDWTLFMNETKQSFCGCFEYNRDLFCPETMISLQTRFLFILENYLQSPTQIGDLDGEPSDRNQGVEYCLIHKTILDLFASQVQLVSSHCALVYENESITFQALDQYANQIARYLIRNSVFPDSVVAVRMSHSINMIATILAILKIGAAFLPLDPKIPVERLEFIFLNSDCILCVIDQESEELSINTLNMHEAVQESSSPLPDFASLDSIAYIMYTSGSTGKPKGVAVSHRSLINYLLAIQKHYSIFSLVHMPLYSSLAFDLTLTSLFFPLLFGHTLHIFSEREDIGTVLEKVFHHPQITHVKLTPAHLRLLETLKISSRAVTQLIIGGEQLTLLLANQIYKQFHQRVTIVNEYGPTEATVGCLYFIYPPASTSTNVVPIGTPMQNTAVYNLSESLQSLPVNIVGELYLAGINLAYGYWHEPKLTAERFLPNPYLKGKRMYKSGDLSKKLPSGMWLFLGRSDRQVKIRGYRIEIEEIETHLQNHPMVKECIVLAHENGDVLCAYYTTHMSQIPNPRALRDFLNQILPHYMIPSAFLLCKEIPLTINGKIDVKALPSFKVGLLEELEYQAPYNSQQRQLVEIWSQVLDQTADRIGINQSFFELGGDSIKAMQIVIKSRTIGIHFSIGDLFKYPTIESLSFQSLKPSAMVVSKGYSFLEGNIDLSPMQRWFFHYFADYPHYYNQVVHLHCKYGFDQTIIYDSFQQIMIHHEVLRTVFPTSERGVIMPFSENLFTLHVFDYQLTKICQQSIEKEISFLQSSLNIHKGPLIRLALFHTLEGCHLFIIIHHLLIDGVSWRIILEDFDIAYQQMKSNKPVVLPAKTHSYKQWVALQTQSNDKRSAKLFAISKQKEKSFTLSIPNTLKLIQAVPKAYHTQINEILLAALYLAFHQVLDLWQVFLHVESHGRNQLDLTRTVGWFTALTPIILEVENSQDISCVIKTIKESIKRPLMKEKQNSPSTSFNYLGQLNSKEYQSFTYTPILEKLVDPRAALPYNLQIIIFIFDQRLHCHIFFDEEIYLEDTQELFLKGYERNLVEIIQHCSCKSYAEFTPSDFGSYFTSLKDWDTLLAQISQYNQKGADAIAKIYPLLPLQQGLLYHALQEPNSNAYIEQAVLCLEGNIDVLHWQMGLQQLITAYESLRAAFFHDGILVPHQVILKNRPLSFFYEDCRNNNFSIEEFLKKDRKKGFDLVQEPLIRFFLLRVDERRYYVIWSFHHLILDGWSLSLLFHSLLKNLLILYEGKSFSFDSSSLRNYFDWYQSRDLLGASSYWKQLLGDYQNQATLPRMRVSNQDKDTKKISVSFPIQKIQQIAKEQDLTLSSLFQAIWALLLMHYTKQNDLVFGTVFSGRDPDIPDVEQMVGLLIVTLPLRVRIKSQEKLVDLARFIQRQLLQSTQAQLPLSEIQTASTFNQHLIDHLFVFENYPFAGQVENMVQNSALPIKFISAELLEETHYNFLLSFLPTTVEIMMEIQYNSSLYSSSFVNAIPAHFEQIIAAISACPLILVNEIALISDVAKNQIHIFNKTEKPYFAEKTLPELFQRQVQRTPDRIALTFENEQLSYYELDRRSTCLASFLTLQGTGPEQCIGIYIQPSFEMVVAWLAVLKTGCAYIPFDPSWSSDRISSINSEANFIFILTSESLFPYLPSLSASVIQLDLQWSLIENALQSSFFEIDSEQIAYVLYTSGSTGKPKGVAVTHRAICNHLNWVIQQFALGLKDRMLQLTSFAFDVSLCELYILFVGGTLVLAPSSANRDVNILLSIIEKQSISFLQMVPSLLEILLEPEILNRLSSVRQVLCGADILKKEHFEQWLKGCSIPLTNLYGLTETCIDATYYQNQVPYKGSSVPIGRPLSNVQAYVLDCYLALLPEDTPGELYIGGLCLARGYYHRPDLTAERFLPHPFDPGKRIYRTLDLACWQSDNYLKYLGRIDGLVKIRGFRIEVGEVEAVLSLYPDVVQVLIRAIGEDSHRALCAYLTAKKQLDPFLLHWFLERQLPHYMVPAYYVQLAAFPLTPHGKIDNTALPHPQENVKQVYESPQSEMEKQLTALWKQVLKIDDVKIGIDHNFFDIGGSSMTLMQLHYHLTQTSSYRISVEKLFQYPTIRKLAAFLSQKKEMTLDIEKLDQRVKKRQSMLIKRATDVSIE